MRRIVVSEFVSLDGVTEAPEKWSITYWNDDIAKFKADELSSAGALLLGRVTYDIFAASWPNRSGDPYTDRMNSMPKFVATRTQQPLTWNAKRLDSETASAVRQLKAEPGGDLLVFGSTMFAEYLRNEGLVDRYHLLTYPVVLGQGKRLFTTGAPSTFKLSQSQNLGGVALSIYDAK